MWYGMVPEETAPRSSERWASIGSAASSLLLAGTESCGARETSSCRRAGLSRPRSEEARCRSRFGRFCCSSRAHATIGALVLDVRNSSNALLEHGFTMSHWYSLPKQLPASKRHWHEVHSDESAVLNSEGATHLGDASHLPWSSAMMTQAPASGSPPIPWCRFRCSGKQACLFGQVWKVSHDEIVHEGVAPCPSRSNADGHDEQAALGFCARTVEGAASLCVALCVEMCSTSARASRDNRPCEGATHLGDASHLPWSSAMMTQAPASGSPPIPWCRFRCSGKQACLFGQVWKVSHDEIVHEGVAPCPSRSNADGHDEQAALGFCARTVEGAASLRVALCVEMCSTSARASRDNRPCAGATHLGDASHLPWSSAMMTQAPASGSPPSPWCRFRYAFVYANPVLGGCVWMASLRGALSPRIPHQSV